MSRSAVTIDRQLRQRAMGSDRPIVVLCVDQSGQPGKRQRIEQTSITTPEMAKLVLDLMLEIRDEGRLAAAAAGQPLLHILREGEALCGLPGPPSRWPPGHVWIAAAPDASVSLVGPAKFVGYPPRPAACPACEAAR